MFLPRARSLLLAPAMPTEIHVGILTGALAGGLESRMIIRHLALFSDEP